MLTVEWFIMYICCDHHIILSLALLFCLYLLNGIHAVFIVQLLI